MRPSTSLLGASRLPLTTKRGNKDFYKGASTSTSTSAWCRNELRSSITQGQGSRTSRAGGTGRVRLVNTS